MRDSGYAAMALTVTIMKTETTTIINVFFNAVKRLPTSTAFIKFSKYKALGRAHREPVSERLLRTCCRECTKGQDEI